MDIWIVTMQREIYVEPNTFYTILLLIFFRFRPYFFLPFFLYLSSSLVLVLFILVLPSRHITTITVRARWKERERERGREWRYSHGRNASLISFANNATIQHFRSPCVCRTRRLRRALRMYRLPQRFSTSFFFFIIHSGLLTSCPLDRQTKILQQQKEQ